jgi:hypothetical protein
MRALFFALSVSLGLTACSTPGSNPLPLIPDEVIVISAGQGGTITAGAAVAAAAVYMVYDPLAPNWDLTERVLTEDSYRLSLRMKRFNTGGDGDALHIVKRRAQTLQNEQAMAGYRLVQFDQGIDSQTVGARRFAEAVIQLIPYAAPPAPKVYPEMVGTTRIAQPAPVANVKKSAPVVKKPPKAKKPSSAGCDCKDEKGT